MVTAFPWTGFAQMKTTSYRNEQSGITLAVTIRKSKTMVKQLVN